MVYFIQGAKTKLIKIGKTRNPIQRLWNLQSGSPDQLTILKVIPGETDDAPHHERFGGSWSHGEWFKPTADLTTFIGGLAVGDYDGVFVQASNASIPQAALVMQPEMSERVKRLALDLVRIRRESLTRYFAVAAPPPEAIPEPAFEPSAASLLELDCKYPRIDLANFDWSDSPQAFTHNCEALEQNLDKGICFDELKRCLLEHRYVRGLPVLARE